MSDTLVPLEHTISSGICRMPGKSYISSFWNHNSATHSSFSKWSKSKLSISNKADQNCVIYLYHRTSKTLLHRCHLILRQWKKELGQLSCCFLGRNLFILAGHFCFNVPFLEVALFSPYLNLNIRMTAMVTSKRNVRCCSCSRHPILNSLISQRSNSC